uniref:Non-structural protein n=1 Tax=Rice ragged stunt virus TaxID=42475 RepID=F4YTV5_RRSV|nr:non-structural protein [Rice ragged stunt virus]
MPFVQFPNLFEISKFARQGKTVSELKCEVWTDLLSYLRTGLPTGLLSDFAEHHGLNQLQAFTAVQFDEPCFVLPARAAIIVYCPEQDDMLSGVFEVDATGKRTFVRTSNTDIIGSAKSDVSGGKQIQSVGVAQGLETVMQMMDYILIQFHVQFGSFTDIGHFGMMRDAIQLYGTCACPFLLSLARFSTALSYLNAKLPSIVGLHYSGEPTTLGGIITRGVNLSAREAYFSKKYDPAQSLVVSAFFTVKTSASGATVIEKMSSDIGLVYHMNRAAAVKVVSSRIGRLGEVANFGDDAE